jgi:thioredoxin-related protein
MIKQLKCLLLLWLLPLIAVANYVHWLGDYKQALQFAHKEHKPLLVLVVKKESKQCNTIIKDQFMDHSYIERINQKMIPVIVTYEGVLSYPIEMYYTTIFPTLFFIDSQKELFLREPLYGDEIDFKKLKKILNEL